MSDLEGHAHSVAAPDRPHRNAFAIAFFGLTTLLLLMICEMWLDLGRPWGPGVTTILAWVLFAAMIVACWKQLSPMDPVVWVTVVVLLFYFGMPVAVELIGGERFPHYGSFAYGQQSPHIDYGFMAALLSLSGFLLGLMLPGLRDVSGPPKTDVAFPQAMSVAIAGIAVTAIGYLFLIVGIALVGPSLLFGYYDVMRVAATFGDRDFSWFNAGLLIAPVGAIALIACSRRGSTWLGWLGIAAVGPVALLMLATGDRGGLAALAFMIGWAIVVRFRRIPWSIVIAGFITAFVILPMVKEWRVYRSVEEASQMSVAELAGSAFYEMGSTVQIFDYTLAGIPSTQPYSMGVTFAYPFAHLIPWGGRRITNLFPLDRRQYNPNDWVSSMVDPTSYELKGAHHGYAIGAEWYFNFGMIGIAFGMMLMGALTTYFRNRSLDGPAWLVWGALYFGFMTLVIRNSLGYPLRSLFWPMFVFLGVYLLIPRSTARTFAPPPASGPDLPHLPMANSDEAA